MVVHHKTIISLVSSQAFQGSRVFVPTWLPRLVTQPTVVVKLQRIFPTKALGLLTQPTSFLGFQRICPTRAYRTSNSTHQGLLENFFNQASRTSNSTQVVIGLPGTNNSTQAKETLESTKNKQ